MDLYQIIKRPLVTEKVMAAMGATNRYAFEVDRRATKPQIQRAVEKLFNVHVNSINTCILRGKMKKVGRNIGKKPNWKKAIVSLREGEKIELFEGV